MKNVSYATPASVAATPIKRVTYRSLKKQGLLNILYKIFWRTHIRRHHYFLFFSFIFRFMYEWCKQWCTVYKSLPVRTISVFRIIHFPLNLLHKHSAGSSNYEQVTLSMCVWNNFKTFIFPLFRLFFFLLTVLQFNNLFLYILYFFLFW